MAETELAGRIGAVRAFNRFYTRQIRVLQEGMLNSGYSLAEARVIYELAQRDGLTASALSDMLGIDPGYLSRMLRTFRNQGLVEKRRDPEDGRQSLLALTNLGRGAFAALDEASDADIGRMLETLAPAERERLVSAMARIERLLGPPDAATEPYILRPHRPGDIGWVIERHAVLYAREFGFDSTFEGFVAEIAGGFLKNHDPARERCWIAEQDGERIGCVFVVRETDTTARLRMLLVEHSARGLGLGKRLVEESIIFARAAGYAKLTLWTNDILTAARRIYEATGFRLVAEGPHRSFGHDLVGQTWELDL